MTDESSHHRNRYDTSGNPEAEYVDAAHEVLINLHGIEDLAALQLAEEEALVAAYAVVLSQVRVATPLTCNLIKHIHGLIFGKLFAWAGRWRTVWISKPGTTWPPPDFLEQNMQEFEQNVLAAYPADKLVNDELFCQAIAEIQGEFLVIHPFREGNARTIKLVTDILAAQSERPLLMYDQTAAGQSAYIEAAKAAFKRDYAPLTAIIQQALVAARS
jgi:cell filamentation protein